MMLVLGRRRGESLMIGDDIEVIVVESDHGQTRLGIKAPVEIKVWRREIWEKIQAEKEAEKVSEVDHDGTGD
jgi:carbon storage regulator